MTHRVSVILLSPSRPRRLMNDLCFAAVRLRDRCASRVASHGPSRRSSSPRTVRTARADAIDRWPIVWPLAAAIAAWPSIVWSVHRFADRSDDPFGIVAWLALLFALVVARRRFHHPARSGRLAAAVGTALLAALPIAAFPDLFRALLAVVSIVLALGAIVDDDEPFAPYAGLALLALPLLSSLQFYAGYPLRIVTAEASRWLLTAGGATVERTGSALLVDGHLVLVDAPCSGVQMAWLGYFTACFCAWLFRTTDAALGKRMPLVGLLILGGNVARNTILVALEAHGPLAGTAHDAIGLGIVAMVSGAIVALFATCRERVQALCRIRIDARRIADDDRDRVEPTARHPLALLAFAGAALLPLVPLAHQRPTAPATSRVVEWPTRLDGAALVPLALSDVERRFAAGFPGAIARFASGPRAVVLRDVDEPTRKLHPATDCYRALGYAIATERLQRDAAQRLWRCFDARRRGDGLMVCERIVDADGVAYTDVSSWYWSSLLGQSRGPWRATTIATRLDAGAA